MNLIEMVTRADARVTLRHTAQTDQSGSRRLDDLVVHPVKQRSFGYYPGATARRLRKWRTVDGHRLCRSAVDLAAFIARRFTDAVMVERALVVWHRNITVMMSSSFVTMGLIGSGLLDRRGPVHTCGVRDSKQTWLEREENDEHEREGCSQQP